MESKDNTERILEDLGVVTCHQKIGDTSFCWEMGKEGGFFIIKTYVDGVMTSERREEDFSTLLSWMNCDILDKFAPAEDAYDYCTDRDTTNAWGDLLN